MRTKQVWCQAVINALAVGGAIVLASCLAGCAGQVGDGDGSDGETSTSGFVGGRGPNGGAASGHHGERENVRSTTSALRDEHAEPNPDPWHGAAPGDKEEPNPDPWNPNSSSGQENK